MNIIFAQTKYLTSLCENYKDFVYIFDDDLGVYVVSDCPTSTNTEYVFVNITDENKKDSLDDVIEFIDDYYNDLKDDDDINISENINSNSKYNDFDVFQLLDYTCDPEAGINGDYIYCLGEFFADDINDARRQLSVAKSKYPEFFNRFKSNPYEDIYVDKYNAYFDKGPECYQDLDTLINNIWNIDTPYIDNDFEELPFTESIESLNEDSLKDMFGDVFLVTVTKSEDGEKEYIEFNNIKDAQDYIDKLKIDNDDFFSSAVLVDENGEKLDSWNYISDEDRSNDKLVKRVAVKEAEEDFVVEVDKDDVVAEIIDDEKVDTEDTINSDLIFALNAATNAACTFANNMKMLHWYSAGNNFDRIHQITSDYYDKAGEDLDLLAELVLEFGGKVVNPSIMASACDCIELVEITEDIGYDRDICLSLVRENIAKYSDALKNIYNATDVTSDVTSEIDTIVRYWDKENNYKTIRRLAEF